MIAKDHAEQIVNFALKPISGGPDARHTFNAVTAGRDLQTYPLVFRDRVQVVNDLERSFSFVGIMNAGEIGKIVKRRLRIILQRVANFGDTRAPDANGELTEKFARFDYRVAELPFQTLHERMIRSIDRLGPFFLFLYRRF